MISAGSELDVFYVVVELGDFVDDHAPLNATKNGGLAIMGEIHAGRSAEELEDSVEAGVSSREGVFGLDTGASDVRVVSDKGQFLGNVLRREHVVDGAGGDGAAGHAVVFRGVFILGKSDAALRLNFGHAECAVACQCRRE